MLSPHHPPQLKWFSFVLFLLTLILEISFTATSGPCEERCEMDRPFWSTKPYTLQCSTEYYGSVSEIDSCRANCRHCSKEICELTDSDIYMCPAKFGPSPPISEECKKRCDKTRPLGTTEAYTLSCKVEYDTEEKIDECRADCPKCLKSICSPYDPDIFHCPSGKKREPLTGPCKTHCDNNRKPETTAAYTINCEEFEFEDEAHDCRSFCRDDECPDEVCDYYRNENIFNCPKIPFPLPPPPPPPPPTYEGYCKTTCDDKRPKGPYGPSSKPYTFKCREKYDGWDMRTEQKVCNRNCKRCPSENCQFSMNENNEFNCKTFQLERRCNDICNANRKYGSTEAYTLKCSTAYSTKWEIQYCKDHCVDCSSDVCDPTLDNDTYNCPIYIVPVVERPDRYSGREANQTGTLAVVGFFMGLLLMALCIGACIYCCVKQRSVVPTGQYYAAPGGVGYPVGGQQPYPVNNYAQGYPTGGQYAQQQQPYPMNYYGYSQQGASSIPVPKST